MRCEITKSIKIFAFADEAASSVDGLKALEKEGDTSIIGEFKYENNDIAFDTACDTFKMLLGEI